MSGCSRGPPAAEARVAGGCRAAVRARASRASRRASRACAAAGPSPRPARRSSRRPGSGGSRRRRRGCRAPRSARRRARARASTSRCSTSSTDVSEATASTAALMALRVGLSRSAMPLPPDPLRAHPARTPRAPTARCAPGRAPASRPARESTRRRARRAPRCAALPHRCDLCVQRSLAQRPLAGGRGVVVDHKQDHVVPGGDVDVRDRAGAAVDVAVASMSTGGKKRGTAELAATARDVHAVGLAEHPQRALERLDRGDRQDRAWPVVRAQEQRHDRDPQRFGHRPRAHRLGARLRPLDLGARGRVRPLLGEVGDDRRVGLGQRLVEVDE